MREALEKRSVGRDRAVHWSSGDPPRWSGRTESASARIVLGLVVRLLCGGAELAQHLSVVRMLEPGERHWDILSQLLTDAQVTGPLVTDAALAALALEHGASVCTLDRAFFRFPGLTVIDPSEV